MTDQHGLSKANLAAQDPATTEAPPEAGTTVRQEGDADLQQALQCVESLLDDLQLLASVAPSGGDRIMAVSHMTVPLFCTAFKSLREGIVPAQKALDPVKDKLEKAAEELLPRGPVSICGQDVVSYHQAAVDAARDLKQRIRDAAAKRLDIELYQTANDKWGDTVGSYVELDLNLVTEGNLHVFCEVLDLDPDEIGTLRAMAEREHRIACSNRAKQDTGPPQIVVNPSEVVVNPPQIVVNVDKEFLNGRAGNHLQPARTDADDNREPPEHEISPSEGDEREWILVTQAATRLGLSLRQLDAYVAAHPDKLRTRPHPRHKRRRQARAADVLRLEMERDEEAFEAMDAPAADDLPSFSEEGVNRLAERVAKIKAGKRRK